MNCAHVLSNWMILNGMIKPKALGSATDGYCPKGRMLRAKEMRTVFTNMGLSMQKNPPKDNRNCFIYCESNADHQGHVYYGRR